MKCPVCKCEKFFVKDPDDEYETYGIELKDGHPVFCDQDEAGDLQLDGGTETYCNKCAWHGKLQELN